MMITAISAGVATSLLAMALQAQPQTGPCAALPPATTQGFQTLLQSFLDNKCYATWVHDPEIRTTNGVHPNVQVYYSPSIWQWLTTGNRQGNAPEGGMLVKAQYGFGDSAHPGPLSDWSVMVKDQGGAWDGWYWADLVPTGSIVPGPSSPPPMNGPSCNEAQFSSNGFGQYCINCHGSAANNQNTFATTKFVLGLALGGPLSNFPAQDDIHYRLSHLQTSLLKLNNDATCMIPESNDHVVADSQPSGPQKFVTSDQCTGCHNATATLTPARPDLPSMLFYKQQSPANTVNLSPNGEWRFSLMGLAGRDPIFFSQLNSESTLHGNLQDHPGQAKEFIQDLCLHCHGVMGQRQYQQDTGKLFTREHLQDPDSIYGALARDGISCTVCHRISPEGLGTDATYTGNFKVGPPNQINGPFSDIIDLPMKNALGMTPQQGDQIKSSALCGSCHTIILPVYRANGAPVIVNGPNGEQKKTFVEQATFFEWQNSRFADNGASPQSCQECHMPNTFLHDGVSIPLAFRIANIEDNTFPAVDHRAPDDQITLKTRTDYRRHTLLGINVFALEMFKQFRTELGLYKDDPMMRSSLGTEPGIETAIDMSSNMIAKTKTATVKILSAIKVPGKIAIKVQVTNNAGHSFPSGVSFRRAFLNLQVLNGNQDVVWESGKVAPDDSPLLLKGMILDGASKPLITEIFTPAQQSFQLHYWMDRPIMRENQVQIYEELVRNPEGLLTTSFIALDQKVKDNRLQPQGWSPTGPQAQETGPVGTCLEQVFGKSLCDPNYRDGSGSNVVAYVVPMMPKTLGAASVRATLYYQSIPPYYQLQRATDASGMDTDRLVRFIQNLSVAGTAVERWVLPIASDEAPVQR